MAKCGFLRRVRKRDLGFSRDDGKENGNYIWGSGFRGGLEFRALGFIGVQDLLSSWCMRSPSDREIVVFAVEQMSCNGHCHKVRSTGDFHAEIC